MVARTNQVTRNQSVVAAPAACFECPVRHIAICKEMADKDITALFSRATEHTFEPGQHIVETGKAAGYIDILRTGSAYVYRTLPDLRRAITQVLMPSDIFGLSSFGEYAFSVRATRKTRICRFRADDIDDLMGEFPDLQRAIRHYLNLLTHILEERTVTLGMKNSLQRVASFIINIWAYSDWSENENTSFELPLSRDEIGDLTGLAPETVSKCFTALQKMRLIDLPRPQEVKVIDKKNFLALSYSPTDLPQDMQALIQNFQK